MLSDRKGGWNDGDQTFQEIISAQFLVLLPAHVRWCERADEQHRSGKQAATSHSFVYRSWSVASCQQWLAVLAVGGGGCVRAMRVDFGLAKICWSRFGCTLSLTSHNYRIPLPSVTPPTPP